MFLLARPGQEGGVHVTSPGSRDVVVGRDAVAGDGVAVGCELERLTASEKVVVESAQAVAQLAQVTGHPGRQGAGVEVVDGNQGHGRSRMMAQIDAGISQVGQPP